MSADFDLATKTKGSITELIIAAALLKLGKTVLKPLTVERYDLAYFEGGKLIRVQCKTARIRGGCVRFNTSSKKDLKTRRTYENDADIICAYCAENNTCYAIPADRKTEHLLRLDPPKNNQSKLISWAKDFEIK